MTPAKSRHISPHGTGKLPEVKKLPADPEDPMASAEEDPDYIPEEEPFETPPYEQPLPGEGP